MRARRFGLVTVGLAALTLVGAGLAAAADDPAPITSSASGTRDGWYYQLYKQTGTASLTLGSAGDYSVAWNVSTDFFAGKGWGPGARLPVSYTATLSASGLSLLGLYGWTTNPLTEYYVIDNWTTYNPGTGLTRMGTVVTDGGVYDVYRSFHAGMVALPDTGAGGRVAPQSIQPNSWYTYWSIRQNRRTSGTITVANHFDAWSKIGMTVGALDYQMVVVEAYQGSGQATVSIVPQPTPSTSPASTSPTSTSPTSTSPTSTSPTSTTPSTSPTTKVKCRTDKQGRQTCRTVTKKPKPSPTRKG